MRAFALVCFVVACSADRPRAVTIAREPQKPVATTDGSLLPPRAPPSSPTACLMLYECGCNAGCTKIDHAVDGLTPGMQVAFASGPFKGAPLFVAKQTTQSGEPVLTVQRADPKASIQICAATPRTSVVGYLCAMDNSGPARACGACE